MNLESIINSTKEVLNRGAGWVKRHVGAGYLATALAAGGGVALAEQEASAQQARSAATDREDAYYIALARHYPGETPSGDTYCMTGSFSRIMESNLIPPEWALQMRLFQESMLNDEAYARSIVACYDVPLPQDLRQLDPTHFVPRYSYMIFNFAYAADGPSTDRRPAITVTLDGASGTLRLPPYDQDSFLWVRIGPTVAGGINNLRRGHNPNLDMTEIRSLVADQRHDGEPAYPSEDIFGLWCDPDSLSEGRTPSCGPDPSYGTHLRDVVVRVPAAQVRRQGDRVIAQSPDGRIYPHLSHTEFVELRSGGRITEYLIHERILPECGFDHSVLQTHDPARRSEGTTAERAGGFVVPIYLLGLPHGPSDRPPQVVERVVDRIVDRDMPDCSDTRDNDGDGQTDYPQDTDCTGLDDTSEAGAPPTPAPTPTPTPTPVPTPTPTPTPTPPPVPPPTDFDPRWLLDLTGMYIGDISGNLLPEPGFVIRAGFLPRVGRSRWYLGPTLGFGYGGSRTIDSEAEGTPNSDGFRGYTSEQGTSHVYIFDLGLETRYRPSPHVEIFLVLGFRDIYETGDGQQVVENRRGTDEVVDRREGTFEVSEHHPEAVIDVGVCYRPGDHFSVCAQGGISTDGHNAQGEAGINFTFEW